MRYDSADPELVDAVHDSAGDYVEVALDRGGDVGRFRFGTSSIVRALVQRILGTRPFDAASGLPYRYFYAGQGGHGLPMRHLLYVRIELGPDARTMEFESPWELVETLEWFRQLPSLSAAAHLRAPA
jgi:hypothetical protein